MQRYCRNIEDLPAEVVEHAISYVPPKDLCNVVLVSSKMSTLASNPKLWTQMKVNEAKIQQNGLTELFSTNRFSKIRKLYLNMSQMTNEDLVRSINAVKSSSVEELTIEAVNFNETPSNMLALNRSLKSLSLQWCDITSDQFNNLLVEMCSSESSLVELELYIVQMNDNNVPVELMGKAIGSLQKVIFSEFFLTTEQSAAVLEACIASPQLVDLSLQVIHFFGVPSQLLGRATGHLKKLWLDGREYLDTNQCKAILEAAVVSPTLVDLSIMWSDLEEVAVDLLKKAAGRLHSFGLEGCDVTIEQLVAVLETCIGVQTLDGLSLAWLDLREVPVELLERAAGHLSKMILDFSDFTDEQEDIIDNFDFTKIRITEGN